MREFKNPKRILSFLLALTMVLQYVPLSAFAVTTDNLCEHHTEHTAECHYAEAVAGSPCTHQCGEECAEGCVHTAHDELCGYAQAVEAHECHYECAECVAALTADETTAPSTEATTEPSTEATEPAPVCDCGTDDAAIHATNCPAYVAPENPECFCAEKCTEINIWCDVCGFDYTICEGADTAAVYTLLENAPSKLTVGTDTVINGGVQVTTSGEGWNYDSATNILTLNNANITDGNNGYGAGIYYEGGDLIVKAVGNNTVGYTGNGFSIFFKVDADNRTLTITGDGSLILTGSLYNEYSTGEAKINIVDTTFSTTDISGLGDVTIINSTVIADGAGWAGIYSEANVTITNSYVVAKSSDGGGIQLSDTLTISNSQVEIDGSKGDIVNFKQNVFTNSVITTDAEIVVYGDATLQKPLTVSSGESINFETGASVTNMEMLTIEDGAIIQVNGAEHTHNADSTAAYEKLDETYHTRKVACVDCPIGYIFSSSMEKHSSENENNKVTCTKQAVCDHCGESYGEASGHIPEENATYSVNNDGTHSFTCTVCGSSVTEAHTMDVTTGKCNICDTAMTVIATVTDGSTTLSAADADTLKAATAQLLDAGATDITVTLPEDAGIMVEEYTTPEIFVALKTALAESTAADGSINLTLAGVKAIPDEAFSDYPNSIGGNKLKTLTLTDAETIGYAAFELCTYLESVNAPNATTIGEFVFYKCSNLTFINCPKVTTIDLRAFELCAKLTSFDFTKVTTIGEGAFRGCDFSTIVLPEATSIGGGAFVDNPNLVSFSAPKATSFGYYPWGAETIETSKLETLELTAAGKFTIGNNLSAYTSFNEIDLVLNIDKKDQVTQNDDGTAAWTYTYTYGGRESTETKTFKSITFTCVDGTPDHSYTYTNNGDGTHDATCANCGAVVDNEAHSGGNATCTTSDACTACGGNYFNPNNHEYKKNNGICCETYEPATLVTNENYASLGLKAEYVDYYAISNAGQLYWFARLVNIDGVTDANAILMDNIDLENRVWYPIGLYNDIAEANGLSVQKQYAGTFDGNNHTISNFTAIGNGSQGLFGYCDSSRAQIKNLGVINATVSGWNAGAVAGYCANLTNCYAVGCTITGSSDTNTAPVTISSVGGNNGNTVIDNCWAYDCELIVGEGEADFVMHPVGGVIGSSGNVYTVRNCYYGEIVTDAEFTSTTGAVEKTKAQFASGEVAYLLGTAWGQSIGTDEYPVPGGKTVYEIKICEKTVYSNTDGDIPHNFDEKGFCTVTSGETHYQPALDSDSDGYYEIGNAGQLFWFAQQVNVEGNREIKGVLTANIDLENRPWTPIGSTGENSNNFRGVFDGDGHTITGLYVEGGRAGLGFFGEVRTGTVENFTIYGEVNVTGNYDYVGGVIGSACGLNSNKPDHNGATIRNITSYVNLTAGAHGIGMVGGFVGYANHETLIENCSWYGTFDAGEFRVDSGAGGFIGRIYDSATVTIRNCGAYGTVKTAYKSGTFESKDDIYIGGFLSYSPAGAKTVMENNLWAGRIINNTNLDAANAHLSAYGTLSGDVSITNCYALEGTPYVTTNDAHTGGITTVTDEQLKSGEVAYKLGSAWGQTIDNKSYPVLGGEKVYQVLNCKNENAYSNTNENLGHNYVNGTCTVCGASQTLVSVDISWGAMEFTYTDGQWQPESHTYADGIWTPDVDGGNMITVKNSGKVAVNVTFAYAKTVEAVSGSFTDGTNPITEVALAVNDEKKIYLLLTGKPNETNGYVTLGTITVTITTGGE